MLVVKKKKKKYTQAVCICIPVFSILETLLLYFIINAGSAVLRL
jgi:hypothetical protein